MPLDKSSQRVTNFVIAGEQYCFKGLFYGISIAPTALSSLMSSVFKTVCKNEIIIYLDNVCIQDIRTDTMLQALDQPHKVLENENLRAAPDKTFFFLESALLLGHKIQNRHIHPLKNKED